MSKGFRIRLLSAVISLITLGLAVATGVNPLLHYFVVIVTTSILIFLPWK